MPDGGDCPECDATMERKGASGRDFKGRDVGVTWQECPACGTVVDEFGNVSTPADQQEALEEARRAHRDAQRRQGGGRRD